MKPVTTAPVRQFARVAATMAAFAVGVTPALGQTAGAGRSTGGLFGANSSSSSRSGGQSLSLNINFAEAYDDDVLAEGGPSLTAATNPQSGFYSLLMAGAEYAKRGQRVQLGVNATSTVKYYGQTRTLRSTSSSIAAGLSTALPRRGLWSLNQSVSYSPSYLYGLFPVGNGESPGALPPTSSPDHVVDGNPSYSYATSTALTQGVTRRGSISMSGDLALTRFEQNSVGSRDNKSFSVRGGYGHSLGRNTVANFGYRFVSGAAGITIGRSTVEHGLEFGVQTSRPLSATRKATLTLSLGPSTVNVPRNALSVNDPRSSARERLYRFSGALEAGYDFGRTWRARTAYRSGLEYVPGLLAPVLTSGVSASVGGLLSRRVDVSLTGGFSDGASAVQASSTYSTYSADARLRYALTRRWAAYAEYVFYFYDFAGTTLLAPGMPERLQRNGARVGLTLWLPVVER